MFHWTNFIGVVGVCEMKLIMLNEEFVEEWKLDRIESKMYNSNELKIVKQMKVIVQCNRLFWF